MTTQTQQAPTAQEIATAEHQESMNANRILYQEIQALKAMIATLMMPPAAEPVIAGELSFHADTMTATVDSGKVYWKVKGGSYQQFGVTIWPEVLQDAGFDTDELNPLNTIDLAGYVAVCTVKENGNPKKVIRLEAKQ